MSSSARALRRVGLSVVPGAVPRPGLAASPGASREGGVRKLQVGVNAVPAARQLPWQRGASGELVQAQRAGGELGDGP